MLTIKTKYSVTLKIVEHILDIDGSVVYVYMCTTGTMCRPIFCTEALEILVSNPLISFPVAHIWR